MIIFDTFIFLTNVVFISYFIKKRNVKYLFLVIIINSARLLLTFINNGQQYFLNHFFSMIIFLSLFYFLYSRKNLDIFFNLHNYLKIVILFLFIVFTFKENFLFMHPGIAGWTYKGEFEKNKMVENTEIIEISSENQKVKDVVLNNNKNTKINGFSNGYKDQYELSMAVTNLGTFPINYGDYKFVFTDEIFKHLDNNQLLKIKKDILNLTLCDRLNNRSFLIPNSISYPGHSVYFNLRRNDIGCDDKLTVLSIENYIVYSNIDKDNYEVKKIVKKNR